MSSRSKPLPLNFAQLGNNLLRYFQQRYSIFNFYDYDIRLTDAAWFGVTPEPVATLVTRTPFTIPSLTH